AVVALLRGDHTLNETKLAAIALGEVRPMTAEEIQATFGAPAGYLGPIGIEAAPHPRKPGVLLVLDKALEGRVNLVAGANKEEYHLRNVTPGRDFKPTVIADVRNINEGELDPLGGQPLRLGKAVEIGHIFKLGFKYSESMGARVTDASGKEVTPIMGSYGIGVERILTAAIESSAAANKARFADTEAAEQYVLPAAIAPYEVVVTVTNVKDPALMAAGESIAIDLAAAGVDVLLDDRDERAGVKFKDAELIGVPYRINIGKKLAEGKVELVDRLTQTNSDHASNEIATHLRSLLASSNN
ncbi:MAG: YbaK/EbsC family protein, partial [Bryocella sp.]